MADDPTKLPVVLLAVLATALVGTVGAWLWFVYLEHPEPTPTSADRPAPDTGVLHGNPVQISDDGATVELDDPMLRLVFFGPDGRQNHVIRVGDLPPPQRRCVVLAHPELPTDATFLADFNRQEIRPADDTAGNDLPVTGRRATIERARACSRAAWRAHQLGTHISTYTAEFAKLHPESTRAASAERAKQLLLESTSAPDAGTQAPR